MSIKRCKGSFGPAVGDVDLQALLTAAEGAEVRHRPVQVDQVQQTLDDPSRLAKCHAEQPLHGQAGLDRGITVVGLSTAFASRRRPHIIARSNHIASEPRRLSAALQAGQFLVLQAGGVGLLMPSSYHNGFTR